MARWDRLRYFILHKPESVDTEERALAQECRPKEVRKMRDVHIMDELKENKGWVFLFGAFLIGILSFALMTAGFIK